MSTEEGGFDLRLLGPTPADYELARESFDQGASFQTIRQRLLHSGLKPEHVETTIMDIASEDVKSLVVAGSANALIVDRLALRGLSEGEITAVIDKLSKKMDRRIQSAVRGPRDKYDLNRSLNGRIIRWIGRKLGLLG